MAPVTDEQLQRFKVECTDCNQTGSISDHADTICGGSIEFSTPCYSCDGQGVYWMEYLTCSEGHSRWRQSTEQCPACFYNHLKNVLQELGLGGHLNEE